MRGVHEVFTELLRQGIDRAESRRIGRCLSEFVLILSGKYDAWRRNIDQTLYTMAFAALNYRSRAIDVDGIEILRAAPRRGECANVIGGIHSFAGSNDGV